MRDRLGIEEYRDELLGLVGRLTETERVPLAEASARVLAQPVTAAAAVPVFANSAMDGFALREADRHLGAELRVVAVVVAGSSLDPALAPGECVRIMTGAPLPSQAEAVVPVELTEESDGMVRIVEEPGDKTHVRGAGEDFLAGSAGWELRWSQSWSCLMIPNALPLGWMRRRLGLTWWCSAAGFRSAIMTWCGRC